MAKNDVVWEIYDSIHDKEGLLRKLAEMYSEPVEAMFDEDATTEKNVTWEASW